ncbi:MAG: alpha/beta fold hydrolase [Mycobacteriales bacterium]
MPPDAREVIQAPGPWTHTEVSANGVRLHVVEAGTGPLVLLLHGFPQFWWSWRHQLSALADAGFRVAAPDLRGYAGSDKPPRGYDAFTLAADVAALVRVLGERDAIVVGTDWGATLAWTVALTHPRVVRRLAVIGMPHPLRLQQALLHDPRGQASASRHTLTFQLPRYAEGLLTRDEGAYIGQILNDWSGPRWPRTADFADAADRYRAAMQLPAAAHCALEYHRWLVRSQLRTDGWRYRKVMSRPVGVPTLQLHGGADPNMLARSAQGSGRYVAAPYEWRAFAGIGHFPAEEAPELVSGELIAWAKTA